ncbi:hypothetical protein D3875_02860 [Deinococcus cavernae]|uniref:Uncharacterized protein n=1 Tax=Deinococcus cavernae TaxID=2320857 RepID=A0A418VFS6_9DEIO|nr:hypothetical protein [Deinococcus cavernae]RJF74953.1 hypothetical protein D3875_02860 [Deinococcus cavernae]
MNEPSPPMPTASEIARGVGTLPPLALGPLIRRINAANGWGLDFQFGDVPRYLALIHSEIVEAFNDLHRLEAFQRELGDVIVRALDLQQLVQQGTPEVADTANVLAIMYTDYTREQHLLYLHGMTAAALENYRKVEDEQVARLVIMYDLLNLAQEAEYFIRSQGGHTQNILYDILVKNSGRGHRHGGRRA